MLEVVLSQMIYVVWNLPPLVYALIGLATVWYMKTRTRITDNVPPCPVKPYPVLGHLPMLRKDTVEKLKKWHRTTGDVYTLYIGPKMSIVLNSFESVKEAFVNNAECFSNRPHPIVSIDNKSLGIVDSSGFLWREQRGVSVTILKKFGLGKNWLGEKISTEVEAYLDAISKLKGKPTDINLLSYASVANVISTILIGYRFELNDPTFQQMLSHLYEQAQLLRYSSILVYYPWLKYVPGDICKLKRMRENEEEFKDLYTNKHIATAKDNLNQEPGQNFITDYLIEEKTRRKSGQQTSLDEENVNVVIRNLFQAGTETISTTMQWAFLFAILHQDIQEKIYQEILRVVGTDRLPSLEDKPSMNYTSAFIMETQRLGSVVPLGLPHGCSKTTTIAGYIIPEGSAIYANLTAIFHNTEIWGDPLVFRPERFLDNDKNLVVPEQFIPFGIGRRYCLGDSLAKTELFLFVSGVFQRFHLKPEDPDNLPSSLETMLGITSSPRSYRMRIIERKH